MHVEGYFPPLFFGRGRGGGGGGGGGGKGLRWSVGVKGVKSFRGSWTGEPYLSQGSGVF